jgi:biofilm PGA synthesis N-glycosyltransferase PgaC
METVVFEWNGWQFNVLQVLLIAIALLFAMWQLVFHYLYFLKLGKFVSKTPDPDFSPGVSVVICARNEKENLRKHLPAILSQSYPDFEVVVVNDASWDGSDEVLAHFKDQYPHLKIVEIGEEIKRIDGKKFPLTLGIKAASKDILLLTDADCKPVSNEWIAWMVAPYQDEKIEMVLGYSPYENKFSFLNLFIRAETSLTAMMYASLALSGKPYMGVGRNLSYKRELFFRHKGFASHHHIPAGDDDLFVRDAATPHNTAVVLNPKSRMLSLPKNKVKQWIQQKRRHLFVGRFYAPAIKRTLGAFALSHFLFWLSIVALFMFAPSAWIPASILLFRWLLQWPVVYIASQKLGYRLLALFMPFMDFAYLFYSLFGAVVFTFSKKPKW